MNPEETTPPTVETSQESPQVEEQEAPNPAGSKSRKYNKREQQGDNWLRQIKTLPTPTYEECVRRFLEGQSAKSTAHWLLTLPDRGGIQHLGYHSLRAYLQVLRVRVLQADKQ